MLNESGAVTCEKLMRIINGGDWLKALLVGALLFGGCANALTSAKVGDAPKTNNADAADHDKDAAAVKDEGGAGAMTLPMQIKEQPLGEVLAEVTRRSGVRFTLTPTLSDHSVTTTLNGATWSDAVKHFLRSYNHLSIVGSGGSLRRVWILGFGDGVVNQTQPNSAKADPGGSNPFTKRPDEHINSGLPLALWQVAPNKPSVASDLPSEPIEVDPTIFDNLRVGQPLELEIPQEADPIFGVIGETHDQLAGEVQVWSGPLDGTHDSASFTISRGTRTTYITVATGTSIYEVSIDNETGAGNVVNEIDMTDGQDENDIVLPPESKADGGAILPTTQ